MLRCIVWQIDSAVLCLCIVYESLCLDIRHYWHSNRRANGYLFRSLIKFRLSHSISFDIDDNKNQPNREPAIKNYSDFTVISIDFDCISVADFQRHDTRSRDRFKKHFCTLTGNAEITNNCIAVKKKKNSVYRAIVKLLLYFASRLIALCRERKKNNSIGCLRWYSLVLFRLLPAATWLINIYSNNKFL